MALYTHTEGSFRQKYARCIIIMRQTMTGAIKQDQQVETGILLHYDDDCHLKKYASNLAHASQSSPNCNTLGLAEGVGQARYHHSIDGTVTLASMNT